MRNRGSNTILYIKINKNTANQRPHLLRHFGSCYIGPHTGDPSFLSADPKRAREPLHPTLGEGAVPGLPLSNISQCSLQAREAPSKGPSYQCPGFPNEELLEKLCRLRPPRRQAAFSPARLIICNFAV